jgi:atlastin
MKEKKVEVNEEALAHLEKRLKKFGAQKMAVVSVMGAFRTGKSFILDLFLRHLRYEQKAAGEGKAAGSSERPSVPERGGDATYPMPDWLTASGAIMEGMGEKTDGFRFKGGMDHCTEGIWVWSEPFLREIKGEKVALLLMDTQGAWDSQMTKEQSATIFGLTALISSKQIYNISMQIQEDKVENLAYFMNFAQAALRNADQASSGPKNAGSPFQTLDFLVRDWANFEEEWTVAQCKEQMQQHLSKHVDPKNVVENSTAELLDTMFDRISCFCLPHPGLKIQKAAWTGNVTDIDQDFVRFMDEYVHEVFKTGLKPKSIIGSDLSTTTFPLVVRKFVEVFQNAAPAAMSFTQAMTSATILLAKEQVMKSYNSKMSAFARKHTKGVEPAEFEKLHRTTSREVEEQYKSVTILGTDQTRLEAWKEIEDNLTTLYKRFQEDNDRALEKALVAFGNYALLGLVIFVLDRVSDWTCDWWSQTCVDLSKAMFFAYACIGCFVGYQVYVLVNSRGRFAALTALSELWKEMVRLMSIYAEHVQNLEFKELAGHAKYLVEDVQQRFKSLAAAPAGGEPKSDKTKSTGSTGNEHKKSQVSSLARSLAC